MVGQLFKCSSICIVFCGTAYQLSVPLMCHVHAMARDVGDVSKRTPTRSAILLGCGAAQYDGFMYCHAGQPHSEERHTRRTCRLSGAPNRCMACFNARRERERQVFQGTQHIWRCLCDLAQGLGPRKDLTLDGVTRCTRPRSDIFFCSRHIHEPRSRLRQSGLHDALATTLQREQATHEGRIVYGATRHVFEQLCLWRRRRSRTRRASPVCWCSSVVTSLRVCTSLDSYRVSSGFAAWRMRRKSLERPASAKWMNGGTREHGQRSNARRGDTVPTPCMTEST